MKQYEVSANSTVFGIYAAVDEQRAKDACAQDAGYADESDMVARLGIPSELVAVELKASAEHD